MMPYLFFLGDGRGFFVGTTLLLIGVLIPAKTKIQTSIVQIIAATGMLLVIISATPIALLGYLCWFAAVIFVFVQQNKSADSRSIIKIARGLAALCCIMALLWELPYLRHPSMGKMQYKRIYVIGDSISSGISAQEIPWPMLLGQQHKVDVINLAQGGAICRSAMTQAQQVKGENNLAILEIGGNDILNSTPFVEYKTSLEMLLQHLAQKKCKMLLFELPVPPFKNHYHKVQRDLAKKYQVTLIPKRYFTAILAAKNATTDGIHLSPQGHQQMADMVWQIVKDVGW